MRLAPIALCLTILPCLTAESADHIHYPGDPDSPVGDKHVVLISGDHEYRSEEAFPQLAKILSTHHGFETTVLFAIDPETGEINPDHVENIPGLEVLDDADVVVLGLRFRNLPDDQMKRIVDYAEAGRPMVAIRTSTHPFDIPAGRTYHEYTWDNGIRGDDPAPEGFEGGFGQRIFSETWRYHHGDHKVQSTRGIIADPPHPIARGIGDADIWGPTDVYGITLPLRGSDAHAVVLGQVLSGMGPDDPPVADGKNDPMMPVAWTRTYNGGRMFVTTMGSADDLPSEGVRRMIVGGIYWAGSLEDAITGPLKVDLVGDYRPSPYGFDGWVRGKRPEDYASVEGGGDGDS